MLYKLRRSVFGLVFIIFVSTFMVEFCGAREECELVRVDREHPLSVTEFKKGTVKSKMSKYPINYTTKTKRGKVGEKLARELFEKNISLGGKQLISIVTLLRNQNCPIKLSLQDRANRGIDDIFVVRGPDGWIDRDHKPIFHEAKYDGRCQLNLKETKTLCGQLSFQWLDRNLEKTKKRSQHARLCIDGTIFDATSCSTCVGKFQDDIDWLKTMLEKGRFLRTASVLCNDKLTIYPVYASS